MKRLIAHRGVIDGDYTNENTIAKILDALKKGYEVEIDVRYHRNELYLGHDSPQEKVIDLLNGMGWIPSTNLWFHCKDYKSLDFLKDEGVNNYFFHDLDGFTITSKGFFWTADLTGYYPRNTIVVAKTLGDTMTEMKRDASGICSPFVGAVSNVN